MNGLKTYEEAVAVRNQAARLDETVMAFLFNNGERFWLEDDEIQTLIEENVPYQRTVDLVEICLF